MGWPGILMLGAAVGFFGGWLHPLRRTRRAPLLYAVIAGVAAACVANMVGNLTGLFYDGDTLEWLVCVSVSLIAVIAIMQTCARR